MLLAWFLLHYITTVRLLAVQVGYIPHASLAMPSPTATVTMTTCEQCLCTMFNTNGSISALNCYASEASRVGCELFMPDTLPASFESSMKINWSSQFYYRQSILNNQTETTPVPSGIGILRMFNQLRVHIAIWRCETN